MTNAEISAGFEALCVRAAGWRALGPKACAIITNNELDGLARERQINGNKQASRERALFYFSRLMAWIFANLDEDKPDESWRAFGELWTSGSLVNSLRAYHAGTDRGELKALLERVWGPSPLRVHLMEHGRSVGLGFMDGISPTSDLRGLAAREASVPICLCPAASEYDTPCPRHGYLPIGVTGRSDG